MNNDTQFHLLGTPEQLPTISKPISFQSQCAADSAWDMAHGGPRLKLRKAASVSTFHAVGRVVPRGSLKLNPWAFDSARLRG
jgi:hypothetical protein